MAKKSSTIHIEERLWKYIQDYMKSERIDSRNTAIEHILLEHQMFRAVAYNNNSVPAQELAKDRGSELNCDIVPDHVQIPDEDLIIEETNESELAFDIDSLYDQMPDE